MGGTYAIYSSPATGIGLKVPHAQHKVCHQGGRPGDEKQDTLRELIRCL